jgi:hypothetical protein
MDHGATTSAGGSGLAAISGFSLFVGDHLEIDDPRRAASGAMDGLAETIPRIDDTEGEEQRIAAHRANVVEAAGSHGGGRTWGPYKCFAHLAPHVLPDLRNLYGGEPVCRGR